MSKVILVTGPPCAGKNHHIAQHQQPGDTVLDYDAMGAHAYNHAINQLARRTRPPAHTTWVIRCLASASKRAAFAARIRADERIHLAPDTATLKARARTRPDPARTIKAIDTWLHDELHITGDPTPTPHSTW